MTRAITRDEIKRRLDHEGSVVLVEALPEKYFRDAHLPGAIRINHDEVTARAPTLLPDKAASVIVYCASAACQNSGKAARTLEDMGYVNVLVYEGGKEDWIGASLPTHTAPYTKGH